MVDLAKENNAMQKIFNDQAPETRICCTTAQNFLVKTDNRIY